LKKLRHGNVEEVRQGKYFQLKLADGLSEADATAEVDKIAREVLCNPVMEEYSFKIEP
jgi:phosphoribosylformylglycinamidine synthase